jgi:hypothetical protein
LKRVLEEFDLLIAAGHLPDIRNDVIFPTARAALSEAEAVMKAGNDAISAPVPVCNGDDGQAVLGGEAEARTGGATPPTGSHHNLLRQGTRFLHAVEELCDWMNGCDLSSDHADQKPNSYQALCEAMPAFRAALYSAAMVAAPEASVKLCEHDMGFDPERGPNGCRLVLHGQECQCERARSVIKE